MNTNLKADSLPETHPYNSFPIPPDTKTLIVGTAPPPRFSLPRPPHEGPKKGWDADFFYGSGENYLWSYLEKAAGEQIFADPGTAEAAAEDTENLMRDFLRRHRIWMRDVLQTYRRRKGHETSPMDQHIDLTYSGTMFQTFSSNIESSQSIEKIVFTSVQAADWFFSKALALGAGPDNANNYRQMFVAADKARKERSGIQKCTEEFCAANLNDRIIRFYVAPSPSGSARGPNEQTCVEIYRRIIFDRSK
jgi:hypothetical protein